MKLFLSLLCAAAAVTAVADDYASTMYIKGAWGGGSWTWKEMTTIQDGVYSYRTTWASNTGFNTNTAASSSGALWFPKANIKGYDKNVITDGTEVTLVHSAASSTLSVSRTGYGMVVMLLSNNAPSIGDEITVDVYAKNINDDLSFTVTDPDGATVGTYSTYPFSFTVSQSGDYTLYATATDTNDGSTVDETLALTVSEPPVALDFDPTSDELRRCYHEDPATRDITFLFDCTIWGKSASSISSLYVRGSINGWRSSDDCKMIYDSTRNLYYVTVPYNTAKRPGNSGQPEYKFYLNGNYQSTYSGFPSDYIFRNADCNMIVIFAADDIDVIRANSEAANVIKQPSDFDLDTEEGQMEIANYRVVPGTKYLIRTYHPFKWSRTFSTEPYRMRYAAELAANDGVKSDIVLSGDETGSLTSYTVDGVTYQESIPEYYQTMINGGHVLYVGKGYSTPSYNEVYYNPTGDKLAYWINETVDFILSDTNAVPMTIHCRLGTDRTGVFCAILGALCGATWDEVVYDYELSNRLGTQEFRGGALLRYAFETMLGVTDISEVSDLSSAVADYFVNRGALTTGDIEALKVKLNGQETDHVTLSTADASQMPTKYYNLQGVRVALPAKGQLVIAVQGDKCFKVVY
ncbi:MAG: tyrosine-protein phosphatase [Bacteroidales bacterium]|nr:tyrosine-protein phosphatase [Bacteroidales bacterium]